MPSELLAAVDAWLPKAPGAERPSHASVPPLPVAVVDPHVVTCRAPASSESAPSGGGRRLLVVDDEEAIASLLSRGLQRMGFEVTSAASAAEALTHFLATPRAFDAVLTDLSMPGMNGLQLASEILRERPGLPVLLLSGFVPPDEEQRARELGIREILPKPISIVAAGAILARVLGVPVTTPASGAWLARSQ